MEENAFENVVWKMAAILSRSPCVKTSERFCGINLHWWDSVEFCVTVSVCGLLQNKYVFKGAVSFRFLQGLLTLMCNNSTSKADINCIFFVLRRHRSMVCNWLQNVMIYHQRV